MVSALLKGVAHPVTLVLRIRDRLQIVHKVFGNDKGVIVGETYPFCSFIESLRQGPNQMLSLVSIGHSQG